MSTRHDIPTKTKGSLLSRIARCAALALLWTASACADGSITLKTSVRITADTPIRLGDIAVLRGPESEPLGALDLTQHAARDGRISLHEIRDAINASHTVNWGRLSLSGSECRITVVAPGAAHAAPGLRFDAPSEATDPGVPTVRAAIQPRIAASLELSPDRVRLAFESSEAALELLNTPITARTVEVRPIGRSDTMPIAITVYEGASIVARGTVRAAVEVHRDVAFARVEIPRAAPIINDLIECRREWLPLSQRPFDPAQLGDAVASVRLAPGRMLTEQSVEAPLALKKGDPATIHCLSGGFVMKLRARALSDARPGDTIDFAPLDGRKGRIIRARVDRAGIAIANADDEFDPTPTEGKP